jgi:hypothetical protein
MKHFFQKIGAFFARIFGGARKVIQWLEDHVDDAIDIVGKIKALVENPMTLVLIKLLPDKYEDKIEEGLQKIQPILVKVMEALNLGEGCLQKETFLDQVQCFIEEIRKLSPSHRAAVYHKIASLYAAESSGHELKQNVVETLVQSRFMERKNDIAA